MAGGGEAAGPVEHLEFVGQRPVQHRAGLRLQRARRAAELVVRARHLARHPGLLDGRAAMGRNARGGERRDELRPVGLGEGVVAVADDQGVGAVGVGEVPEQPVLLHQPAGEVEVGLVVLDHVFPFGRIALQLPLIGGEASVAEQDLEDVLGGLVLEHPAIPGVGEEPEPRHDLGNVLRILAAGRLARPEAHHVAVDVARRTLLRRDRARHRLAEDVVRRDRRIVRRQIEAETEQLADPLLAAQPLEDQHVLAERRGDLEEPVLLAQRGHDVLERRSIAETIPSPRPPVTQTRSGRPPSPWNRSRNTTPPPPLTR